MKSLQKNSPEDQFNAKINEIQAQTKAALSKKKYNFAWQIVIKDYQQRQTTISPQDALRICLYSLEIACSKFKSKIYHCSPHHEKLAEVIADLIISATKCFSEQVKFLHPTTFNSLSQKDTFIKFALKAYPQRKIIFDLPTTEFLESHSSSKLLKKFFTILIRTSVNSFHRMVTRTTLKDQIYKQFQILFKIFNAFDSQIFSEQKLDLQIIALKYLHSTNQKASVLSLTYEWPMHFVHKIYKKLRHSTRLRNEGWSEKTKLKHEKQLQSSLRKLNRYLLLSLFHFSISPSCLEFMCDETISLFTAVRSLSAEQKMGKTKFKMVKQTTLDRSSLNEQNYTNEETSKIMISLKEIEQELKQMQAIYELTSDNLNLHFNCRKQISHIILTCFPDIISTHANSHSDPSTNIKLPLHSETKDNRDHFDGKVQSHPTNKINLSQLTHQIQKQVNMPIICQNIVKVGMKAVSLRHEQLMEKWLDSKEIHDVEYIDEDESDEEGRISLQFELNRRKRMMIDKGENTNVKVSLHLNAKAEANAKTNQQSGETYKSYFSLDSIVSTKIQNQLSETNNFLPIEKVNQNLIKLSQQVQSYEEQKNYHLQSINNNHIRQNSLFNAINVLSEPIFKQDFCNQAVRKMEAKVSEHALKWKQLMELKKFPKLKLRSIQVEKASLEKRKNDGIMIGAEFDHLRRDISKYQFEINLEKQKMKQA